MSLYSQPREVLIAKCEALRAELLPLWPRELAEPFDFSCTPQSALVDLVRELEAMRDGEVPQ